MVLIQVVKFQRTKRINDEVLFRTIALGNKYIDEIDYINKR